MKTSAYEIISRISRSWFWGLEIVSVAMVALCWTSAIVPAAFPWNPRSVFAFLFDFSSGVIALLLATTCLLCWKHRRLAFGGLVLCLAWCIWAELPRFATNGSGL